MDLFFFAESINRIVYLLIVGCLAILLYFYFEPCSERYWLVWSAFGLSLLTAGKTFSSRVTRLVLTGLLAMIAVFMSGVFASNVLMLGIYLFFVTAISIYITHLYPRLFLITFIISLFAILSAMHQSLMLLDLKDDDAYILAGILIALLPQIIYWPYYTRNELRFFMSLTMHDLKQVNHEVFSCFLQPEYPDNVYLYERRLHVQKNKFMHSMSLLRENIQFFETKLPEDKRHILTEIEAQLGRSYEIIIDCALLRIRVTDHTIFSVCMDELSNIANEIDKLYDQINRLINGRKYQVNLIEFAEKITRFEECYHGVLQVTAKEPFVFLLFISSLKSLYEETAGIYESILKLNLLLKE